MHEENKRNRNVEGKTSGTGEVELEPTGVVFLSLKNQVDIAKNLRIIEWLKAELVEAVASLFKALLKPGDEAVGDGLATIIISTYILGKRVGVNFQQIDMNIESKLKMSISEAHEIEKWYGDLSALLNYLEKKEK
jgi:hypothetical protein